MPRRKQLIFKIQDLKCAVHIIQERERIRNILEKNHGNVSQTAIELGCSRTALYKKMKKVGLK